MKIDDSRKTYFHQKTDKPKKTPPPPVPFSADETSITILSHGSRNLQYYLTTYARQNIFTKRQIMKYYSKIFISNTFKDWNILKQIEI